MVFGNALVICEIQMRIGRDWKEPVVALPNWGQLSIWELGEG